MSYHRNSDYSATDSGGNRDRGDRDRDYDSANTSASASGSSATISGAAGSASGSNAAGSGSVMSSVLARVAVASTAAAEAAAKPVYLTKAERQALALQRLQSRATNNNNSGVMFTDSGNSNSGASAHSSTSNKNSSSSEANPTSAATTAGAGASGVAPVPISATGLAAINRLFGGSTAAAAAAATAAAGRNLSTPLPSSLAANAKKPAPAAVAKAAPAVIKRSNQGGQGSQNFNPVWDLSDDTTLQEHDPLYLSQASGSSKGGADQPLTGFGRGHLAGVTPNVSAAVLQYAKAASAIAHQSPSYNNNNNTSNGVGNNSNTTMVPTTGGNNAAATIGVMGLQSEHDMVKLAMLKAAKAKARTDRSFVHTQHWSQKSLTAMTDRDWRILREQFSISTKGVRVPPPLRSWAESALPQTLLDSLAVANFSEPSPIQRAAVPVGLANRDVVGIAETGSGKTLAFLLPLFVYILKQSESRRESVRDEGPWAVVMSPTRELAQQTTAESNRFGRFAKIRAVSLVGGQSLDEQAVAMRDGCEIISATPGRLLECINLRMVVLNQCNYIVLDEADRMLDLGFEHQIQGVMEHMPSTNLRPTEEEQWDSTHHYRQTIMFSATMARNVEVMARKYLRNPVVITIGSGGKIADSVTQKIEWVPTDSQKRSRLLALLRQYQRGPIIVFCNRKTTVDSIGRFIKGEMPANIHTVAVVHSGKTQDVRESGLTAFKTGEVSCLVTTDVMSRGIDVAGVRAVINYELPEGEQAFERYTHRVGRTGRGGAEGVAYSFVCDNDKDIMYDLVRRLSEMRVALPGQVRNHPMARAEAKLQLLEESKGKASADSDD